MKAFQCTFFPRPCNRISFIREGFATRFATGFATGLPLDCHWTVANLSSSFNLETGAPSAPAHPSSGAVKLTFLSMSFLKAYYTINVFKSLAS